MQLFSLYEEYLVLSTDPETSMNCRALAGPGAHIAGQVSFFNAYSRVPSKCSGQKRTITFTAQLCPDTLSQCVQVAHPPPPEERLARNPLSMENKFIAIVLIQASNDFGYVHFTHSLWAGEMSTLASVLDYIHMNYVKHRRSPKLFVLRDPGRVS